MKALKLYSDANVAYTAGDLNKAHALYVKAVSEPLDTFDAEQRGLRAQIVNMLGVCEMMRNHFGTAFDLFHEATSLAPNIADFWCHFAQAAGRLGLKDEAVTYGQQSCRLDSKNVRALNGLAFICKEQRKYNEAIACFKQAYDLEPSDTNYFYYADILQWAGRNDESLAVYSDLFAKYPDQPDANFAYTFLCMKMWWLKRNHDWLKAAKSHAIKGMISKVNGNLSRYNLSLIQLTLGELKDGWSNHEARLNFIENESDAAIVATRLNKPLGIKGKVFAHTEQGFGDTFQFCRYLNKLDNYVFEVPAALYDIMKYNFHNVIKRQPEYPAPPKESLDCDSHIPLMSLPHAFGGEDYCAGVYIKAPPDKIEKFKSIKDFKGLRVGVCWAGEKRTYDQILATLDGRRSMSFEAFKPILDVDGVSFFSLQLGKPLLEANGDDRLIRVSGLDTWADTAGMIEHLDLVISVDTAVMHLAAAMGKPVWMLNRFDTCWRWLLDREDTPWYPSVRIFRQDIPNEWGDVVSKVNLELNRLLCNEKIF